MWTTVINGWMSMFIPLQNLAGSTDVLSTVAETDLVHVPELLKMLLRFGINLLFTWCMIHFLYFPKSKRRDFYFTFLLMGMSTFFMVYMLGDVKFKTGFALGLFAIFSIMRFRTEGLPVREMTYLFSIVALSVINALTESSYVEFVLVNCIVFLAVWFFDNKLFLRQLNTKLIQYDKIELILPEKRQELLNDLEKRTGLKIKHIKLGAVDFLRDTAIIKIYYEEEEGRTHSEIDEKLKLKRRDLENV